MDKRKSQKIHARRKAYDRYNLNISNRDLEEINNMIIRGEAVFLKKNTNRVSEYALLFHNILVAISFDHTRKNVNSFLPKHVLTREVNKKRIEEYVASRI